VNGTEKHPEGWPVAAAADFKIEAFGSKRCPTLSPNLCCKKF